MRKSSEITEFLQKLSFSTSGLLAFIAAIAPVSDDFLLSFFTFLGIGIGSTLWIEREKGHRNEIRILRYIKKKQGKATLTELVLDLELPVRTTKKLIEKLQNQDLITLEITEDGEALYCNNDLLNIQKKYSIYNI